MIDEGVRSGVAYALVILALVVIFAPLIAERLRLPGLLGLLIGGVLIGPNVLGVLDDFGPLERIGQVGILYLIFLAGLQLDRETFNRYRGISVGFGLMTSAVSLLLGTLVCLSLGFDTRSSILIGSFWASFTLIAYPVLQQYRLSKNRAGAAVIGASAVTDAVSLLILAVIVGLETGDRSGIGLAISILMGLIILVVWCMVVLPVITRWFFSTLGRGRVLRYMLVFAGLMSAAVVAEIVGVEPLLGAFFAGLGLNRVVPNSSVLMDHVSFVGNALFIPVFLVSVGLLFDPEVMFVPSTLLLGFWLSVALVTGKAVSAWVSGRIYHLTRPESGLLFAVSVAQAAATLAGTIIGFEIGLYGLDVVNAVMVVIAVSLIITSIATPKYAARIEQPVGEERRLGERVVLAVKDAGGRLSDRLRLAGDIAEANDGVVLPVLVTLRESESDIAQSRIQVAAINDSLLALGLDGDTRVRVDRSLEEGIANAAVENDASIVMLGWTGAETGSGFFSETLASEVARHIKCPVAVIAASDGEPDNAVLVVTEGDILPWNLEALAAAAKLAVALAPRRRLVVGPIESSRIAEACIRLPEWTTYEPGEDDTVLWAGKVSRPGDVIVTVLKGRLSERAAQAIRDGERSVIAVCTGKTPRWIPADPSPFTAHAP